MAIMKTGQLVSDVRGKVGGMVFQRFRGVAVGRTKTSRVQTHTKYEHTTKALQSLISKAWRSLSDLQRSSWHNYSQNFMFSNRLGDLRNLTGFALFNRINRIRYPLTGDILTDPVFYHNPCSLVTLNVSIDNEVSNYIVLAVSSTVDDNDHSLQVFTSPPMSGSYHSTRVRYQLIGSYDLPSGENFLEIGDDIVSRYGTILLRAKYFIKARLVHRPSGIPSLPLVNSIYTDVMIPLLIAGDGSYIVTGDDRPIMLS